MYVINDYTISKYRHILLFQDKLMLNKMIIFALISWEKNKLVDRYCALFSSKTITTEITHKEQIVHFHSNSSIYVLSAITTTLQSAYTPGNARAMV